MNQPTIPFAKQAGRPAAGGRRIKIIFPPGAAKLKAVKIKLVRRFIMDFTAVQRRIISQAVDDAQALASATGLPHLFLPALAEEKVRTALNWNGEQRATPPSRDSRLSA